MKKKILTVFAALVMIAAGLMFNAAHAGDHSGNTDKPWICHPANGKGETGYGWNLIDPDQASSHIDESLYPNGQYWKHESQDGERHDVYANQAGECPGAPVEDACPNLTGDQPKGFPCSMKPVISVADMHSESCAEGGRTGWSVTTKTDYVFTNGAWVLGAPVVTESPKHFTAWTPEELKAHGCTKTDVPTGEVPTGNELPPTGILHDGQVPTPKFTKKHKHPAVPTTLPNTGA